MITFRCIRLINGTQRSRLRGVQGFGYQDFPIKTEWVLSLWQQRKCTEEQAVLQLLRSRANRSLVAIENIRTTSRLLLMQRQQEEIEKVQATLFSRWNCFRPDPRVDLFLQQFKPETSGKHLRFRCLGLFGSSRSGKSCKELSLYGAQATLKISCQGLPLGVIPSIARFDREVHKCICWDEIRADQVLGNKEVFQSGPWIVSLGQSVCNQHAYDVWLYHIGHILCSNLFQMTVAQGATEEDADWLDKNLYVATLPKGERWYLGQPEVECKSVVSPGLNCMVQAHAI